MNLIIELQPTNHNKVNVIRWHNFGDFETLAVLPIDTFFTQGGNEIWELLNEGKEVVCTTEWRQYGE